MTNPCETAPNDPDDHNGRIPNQRQLIRAGIAALGIGAAALIACAARTETERLTTVRVDLTLSGWPSSHAGYRFGHLSDVHCNNPRSVERVRRAVDMLLAEEPDAVFLTGDFLDVHDLRWAPRCVDALSPLLRVPGGVFAVLGDHDHWCGGADVITRLMRDAGITVLCNQAAPLGPVPNVWIVGLDDVRMHRQDVAEALRDVPADVVKILLVHEPDWADESPAGFAIQLSGHSHGGQVRLPGLPPIVTPKYGRKYVEGLRQGPHHPVYTTRGVGTAGVPFRLFCPPEVTVLTIS